MTMPDTAPATTPAEVAARGNPTPKERTNPMATPEQLKKLGARIRKERRESGIDAFQIKQTQPARPAPPPAYAPPPESKDDLPF